jgi:transposase
LALRARIILGTAEGQQTAQIARALAVRPATVSKWRCRFAKEGLAGLEDAARPGKPSISSQETGKRGLSQLVLPPPAGYSYWDGRLLAAALGVNPHQVWRILRQLKSKSGSAS